MRNLEGAATKSFTAPSSEPITFADLSPCKKLLAIFVILASLLLLCGLPIWAVLCFLIALLLAPVWWCVVKLYICIFGGMCSEGLSTKLSGSASCWSIFRFLFLESLWLAAEAFHKLWALVIPMPSTEQPASSAKV